MDKKKLLLLTILFSISIAALQAQCLNCDPSNNASGDFSTAIGHTSTASGFASFAAGAHSEAIGLATISLGLWNLNTTDAYYSTTIGSYCKTTANSAMVFGAGISENNYLTNGFSYSLMIGFNSDKPTFFVSHSNGPGYTGKIGIGNVTNPQAKLHIRADDGEEAAVFIEPHSWESGDTALLKLGNQEHFIAADIADGMIYQTQKNHVFKGGDIYIEDIDKGIIMKSPDGRCWRGKLNNNGSLSFTVLESCPGHAPSAIKNNKVQKDEIIKIYPNPAHDFIRVEFLRFSKNTQVQLSLYNQNGQQLLLKNIAASKTLIYIGNLKSGVYFVKGTINGQTETKKIVKK